MAFHLQKEIEALKREMLRLGTLVEENVQKSIVSVTDMSEEQAKSVIEKDDQIDNVELEIEEECLKVLALHQPVAIDLRFIVAILKINNELERIGDLAVNIAERSLSLHQVKNYEIPFDYSIMSQKVTEMLKVSLDALVQFDVAKARKVFTLDDEVDDINRDMYEQVREKVKEDAESVDTMLHYLSISKHLERIGDHTESIAEDVIYMIDGEIVRHQV